MPPSLLGIPLEIRRLIYAELLVDKEFALISDGRRFCSTYHTPESRRSGHARYQPANALRNTSDWSEAFLPLLFACRQIFNELLPFLAAHLTHDIDMRLHAIDDSAVSPWAPLKSCCLSRAHLDNIKRIEALSFQIESKVLAMICQNLPRLIHVVLIAQSKDIRFFDQHNDTCLAGTHGHENLQLIL